MVDRPVKRRRNKTQIAEPLTDEQRDLASRYFPLAVATASRFCQSSRLFRDSIYSAASLGLVYAARSFDPSRGIEFSVFAKHRIVGEIQSAMSAGVKKQLLTNRLHNHTPEVEPIDRHDDFAAIDEMDQALQMLSDLPPMLFSAIKLVIIDGLTQSEAGKRMGVCQASVGNHVRRAREILSESPRLARISAA